MGKELVQREDERGQWENKWLLITAYSGVDSLIHLLPKKGRHTLKLSTKLKSRLFPLYHKVIVSIFKIEMKL